MIGAIPTPCEQKRVYSVAAGAAVAMSPTLTNLLKPLPPVVHFAAGGIALDLFCRGGDIVNGSQELLMSAALGVGGAIAYSAATGKSLMSILY